MLTGFPCRPTHVSPVEIDIRSAYLPKSTEPSPLPWTRLDANLDSDLLEPISVSAAMPCLPDLGMSACLRYHGDGSGVATVPCAWWPSCEALDILPLVAAAVKINGTDLLGPWFERLNRLKVPPIISRGDEAALPHGLMTIEAELMGKSLLQAVVS